MQTLERKLQHMSVVCNFSYHISFISSDSLHLNENTSRIKAAPRNGLISVYADICSLNLKQVVDSC